jgi:hypothetical protein
VAKQEAAIIPIRSRKLRLVAIVLAVLTVLCVGWGAGLKTHELVDLAKASGWVRQAAGDLSSYLNRRREQIVATIERIASTPASQEGSTPDGAPDRSHNEGAMVRAASALTIRMDQLRASTEAAMRELDGGIEHLQGSMERSQGELLAKLDGIQERLERIERQSPTASIGSQVQPQEQTNGRPATPNRSVLPLQSTTPAPSAKGAPPSTEPKRIENWILRDVVDGTAILEGPSGLIGVISGDVVPGLGRVESIVRRGGKWSVLTSKGILTVH